MLGNATWTKSRPGIRQEPLRRAGTSRRQAEPLLPQAIHDARDQELS